MPLYNFTFAFFTELLIISPCHRGAEHIGVALRAQRHNERRHRASRLSSSRIREPDDPFDDTDAPFEDVESETSLKERIRGGGLRPILELGVTPSHISMLLEGGGEDVEVRTEESFYFLLLANLRQFLDNLCTLAQLDDVYRVLMEEKRMRRERRKEKERKRRRRRGRRGRECSVYHWSR